MSTVQNLATALEDVVPPHGGARFATRVPGRSPDAEAWDPVVELVHDLRSPLAAIVALSETLVCDVRGEVNDLHRHQLALLHGAALGLTALLADAVDRAEGGHRPLEREPAPLSVAEVFESVTDAVRPLAEAKGLDLRTRSPGRGHRLAHGPALRRVLLNLTTNALKFTAQGHVEIVGTARSNGRLTISVRDTGGGLPPSVLEALARPLGSTHVDGPFPVEPVSLGLTICRRLVRSMGSELECETRSGGGTRFHFELGQSDVGVS